MCLKNKVITVNYIVLNTFLESVSQSLKVKYPFLYNNKMFYPIIFHYLECLLCTFMSISSRDTWKKRCIDEILEASAYDLYSKYQPQNYEMHTNCIFSLIHV